MNIPVITLTVTNTDYLPDGGPTTYSAQGGAFQIGRDAQREWTLPDPGLFISGNHCAIQFDGQAYLLTDISRNGTFVNGSQSRVKSPYRLQDGDTVAIGHYIISVRIAARWPRAGRQKVFHWPIPPVFAESHQSISPFRRRSK